MKFQTSFLSTVLFAVCVIPAVAAFVLPRTADLERNGEISAPPINQSIILTANAPAMLLLPLPGVPSGTVGFDFDGDGKADFARWQAATGEWRIRQSSAEVVSNQIFGAGGEIIVPADYDGDGKTDLATFAAATGIWKIKSSSGGATQTFTFGQSGDQPVSGDYDGDGQADAAVFRPSNATWYIRKSTTAEIVTQAFGQSGDIPAVGNFDGDTKADYAVFRPATGQWFVLQSATGTLGGATWGVAGDIPVAADYDGDGKTDYAVFRPSGGTWYVLQSRSNGATSTAQVWGNYGDQPVPADYDGDGRADLAIWRPTTGVWHFIKSGDGSYNYRSLGSNGDVPVPAAYLKQIGNTVSAYELAKARLAPLNETGGTNLYSRNFSWGTGRIGLPGRGGLDAGFGISANSLIWTREGNNLWFDADTGNVAPGFRFGFPVIEPSYYDNQTGKFAYLMVSPDGGRREFRQTGASDIYETADSAYSQLKIRGGGGANTPAETQSLTVTATNGTQVNFGWLAGAFRVSRIKDRNGNYLTVNHDELGLLRSVTDTLGRIITVEYDSALDPTAVRQTWQSGNGDGTDTPHNWATFSYTTLTVNTAFAANLNNFGPPNGTVLKVLDKITNADLSSTKFDYNGYGQVWKVSNYAIDGHLLNYTRTDLQAPAANQTDCPRFSLTASWAENYNGLNGIPAETVVTNSFNPNYTATEGGLSVTGTMLEVGLTNDPHGHLSRTIVGAGGWAEGLPLATEDWASATSGGAVAKQRWTLTNWTQDNTALAYPLNPRVTETKVGDGANTKRTTVDYYLNSGTNISIAGLVAQVKVYAGDQATVLKRTTTDYNFDTAYISRRLIGLPTLSKLYDGQDNLLAQVGYQYDEGALNDTTLNQNISPVQHDNTNYGASFNIGRGNQTSVTRFDATGATASVTSQTKYNTAGAAVAQIDPAGRTVQIDYNDTFNSAPSDRNTFAYPTKLTDPAGYFSTVKYRYDLGLNVAAQSPNPTNGANTDGDHGKATTRTFDSLGRLQQETLVNTGAYTRYEYPDNQVQAKVYTTIIDTNGNGADAADEVVSESWTDGAGRVRRSRTENPNSSGGWSGTLTEYDLLGQVKRRSVPTEIDGNWQPAGDDNRGNDVNSNPIWLWTSEEYDWKGRVTKTIPTDSNGNDGKETVIAYDGCGCAGGQVTTIQSELVPRDDQPTVNARRTQKVYADILGRTVKTEVMQWDGITPTTTTVNTFNGRDQLTRVRQFAGAETSATFQDVTMTYDGHGRMKTRRYPIEDANTNTTWSYNPDDSLQQVTDPRGVVTTFSYDDPRGLLTNVAYQVPSTPVIPQPPAVVFGYDALGNRTAMTDGSGATAYTYNRLSQLTAETKTFSGLSGSFTIGYTYQPGGGLQSYTDPFSATVSYTNDKTGRLTKVTGTAFGDNTSGNYLDNIQYRAFGGIKQMTLKTADNNQVSMEYDSRLRVSRHQTSSAQTNATNGFVQQANFTYFNDSSPQAMDNQVNHKFDRSFKYDFAGRLTANTFGNGQGTTAYTQAISYNAFSQMTARSTTHWNMEAGFTAAFSNGRQTNPGVSYDAAGNMTHTETRPDSSRQQTIYDAANRVATVTTSSLLRVGQHDTRLQTDALTQTYDGDGHGVKSQETWTTSGLPPQPPGLPKYEVWSSVLQTPLTELSNEGTKLKTKVLAGGAVIAEQVNTYTAHIEWITADPVTGSSMRLHQSGVFYDDETKQLEPLGQEVLVVEPPVVEEPDPNEASAAVTTHSAGEPEWQCRAAAAARNNFWQQPVHCQQAQIQNLNFSLEGLLSAHTENNPLRMTQPLTTTATLGTAINLRPTIKPDGSANVSGSAVVPSTSQPDDGSEETTLINSGGGGAEQNYFMTVGISFGSSSHGPSLPTDFRGAEFSGQQNKYEPLPAYPKLRDRIVERLDMNNKTCRNFLEGVLKNLGSKETIESLYDNVVKVAGIILSDRPKKTKSGGLGRVGKSPIELPGLPFATSPGEKQFRLDNYIKVIFHELIHEITNDHIKFGIAAFESLTLEEQKQYKLPPKKNDSSYEDYFNLLRNVKCSVPNPNTK